MEQNNAKKSRLPILKERLNVLLEDSTVKDFAEKVGITRQTMGFYLNGERIPDSETLRLICEKCNVSADWLLGLSNDRNRTPAAVDGLGLSEESVKNISCLYNASQLDECLSGLNLLLECKNFLDITLGVFRLRRAVQKAWDTERSFDHVEPTIGDAVFTRDVMYGTVTAEAKEMIYARCPDIRDLVKILIGPDAVRASKADLLQRFDRLISKICDYNAYMDEVDSRNATALEEWSSDEWKSDLQEWNSDEWGSDPFGDD